MQHALRDTMATAVKLSASVRMMLSVTTQMENATAHLDGSEHSVMKASN